MGRYYEAALQGCKLGVSAAHFYDSQHIRRHVRSRTMLHDIGPEARVKHGGASGVPSGAAGALLRYEMILLLSVSPFRLSLIVV